MKAIDPRCLSTDQTTEQFFDRLRFGLFPKGKASRAFEHFRGLCESREREGRGRFGLAYLSNDNEAEALEEAADLAIYMSLAILQARQRGEDEEWATALEAARHAFIAYDFAFKHKAKRHGAA